MSFSRFWLHCAITFPLASLCLSPRQRSGSSSVGLSLSAQAARDSSLKHSVGATISFYALLLHICCSPPSGLHRRLLHSIHHIVHVTTTSKHPAKARHPGNRSFPATLSAASASLNSLPLPPSLSLFLSVTLSLPPSLLLSLPLSVWPSRSPVFSLPGT